MSIETKNKKKILYPYIIFGIILFVILYIINFMYSKYIIGLTIGHNYNVSGIQYHSYKYKTYEVYEPLANKFKNAIENTCNTHKIIIE